MAPSAHKFLCGEISNKGFFHPAEKCRTGIEGVRTGGSEMHSNERACLGPWMVPQPLKSLNQAKTSFANCRAPRAGPHPCSALWDGWWGGPGRW